MQLLLFNITQCQTKLGHEQKCANLRFVSFEFFFISKGSVATQLRCDGIL